MGRLFGTDGARGVANSELTVELATNIGRAAAMVLTENSDKKHPLILIGKDTRLSGDMLEGALTAGLCSVGANVTLLGVVPTPAVAYLVRKYNADAGIMISASHNPFEFNGIKIFAGTGYKLPDAMEEKIEAIVLDGAAPYPDKTGDVLGRVQRNSQALEEYIQFVAASTDQRLEGLRIGIDCSNGSSCVSAEKLFTSLGAECHILSDQPDGININDHCGSTHMENLQKFVVENHLDLGVAFDGDADRCLAVDENGELVDGDAILAICSLDLAERGKLNGNTLVGTVMSNMGLLKFCEANKIHFLATAVGDRYVLEEMLKQDFVLGGEQSGHVIFLDYATTGDGQLTAVQLLSIVQRCKKPLSELAAVMKHYPQVLINVKVTPEGKQQFKEDDEIDRKIKTVVDTLGDRGRILVRMSGTEPLIRVMLEGEDEAEIQRLGNETADLIKTKYGI